MEIQAPIIKGDRVEKADYRDALPVNLTAVAKPIRGSAGYLQSHQGLVQHATGSGIDRGGIWNERLNTHFRVSGNDFISVAADGVVQVLGTISGTDRATVSAYSFNTQSIIADGKWWLYDGSTLTQQLDSDLGTPIDQTWVDSYYFFTDGEFLYHTDITDETSISPLKFATSEFSPDPTLAVDRTSDNQVIVFNRYSTEYFINRATANFAFQRVSNKAIKAGIVGTHCETELEGSFFILGGGKEESPSVHIISSGTYQSIASREVDKLIGQYSEVELSVAVLETRVIDRDKFIVVRLPNETLLCNLTIMKSLGVDSAWTIVKSGIVDETKWRGVNGVFDPRVPAWIYGDNQDSRIGKLDDSIAGQYGEEVEMLFYTPFLDIERASVTEFEIDTIPGIQLASKDVRAAFSTTTNGLTYGREWWDLISEQYNYETRFIVRRPTGYIRQYVGFKVRVVSEERCAFSNMRVEYA